ncbi:STAS domain-containing protein [Shimia biformata]|uniref:STAS domain-containing protein n=1 Tax=Shimia biformata TaxID=1294299 RepID=UPI00194FB59D|nr:STAS domain-containing protein [Shimia biformata]
MELSKRELDGVLIVTVNESRIDSAVAIRFKDMMRQLTENGPERVVLDLAHVDFIDSSGLGAIVGAMKLLGADRRLDLSGLRDNVAKVFTLTRMDRVFRIHMSLSDALGG